MIHGKCIRIDDSTRLCQGEDGRCVEDGRKSDKPPCIGLRRQGIEFIAEVYEVYARLDATGLVQPSASFPSSIIKYANNRN